jgi:hypothetical protein
MAKLTVKHPRAFLSYSYDGPEHRAWVLGLATRLRADGVETILDKWELEPGDPVPEFMEKAVRENDFVLIICTPRYKERSDHRVGGVGYEEDVMTAEVFTKHNQRKFKPVLRSEEWQESAPTWLNGKLYVDLGGDPYSEEQYQELLQSLLGTRPKPPRVKLAVHRKNVLESSEPRTRVTSTHGSAPVRATQSVSGHHNVVAGRDVNINKREVTRLSVIPGPEHITEEQAKRLKDLVDKAAKIEIAAGSEPRKTYAKWWSELTNRYEVTSYRLIPRLLGSEAIKWLEQRAAMLRPKLRRANPLAWRVEHYAAIWARARELSMSKGAVYSLVKERLGLQVVSLKLLGEHNLKHLYNIMMSLDGKPDQ